MVGGEEGNGWGGRELKTQMVGGEEQFYGLKMACIF